MGINSIKPNFIKFSEDPAAAPDPALQTRAEELKNELETALQNLEGSKDYYEYMSMADQASIESMKSRIRGEITLLDTFIETGKWPGTGDINGGEGLWQELPELTAGWHGDYQLMSEDEDAYWGYSDAIEASPDGGTLEGVITVPRHSGDPTLDTLQGAAIGLAITDQDGITKVRGKTVGEDIWVTAEYENGDIKTWVLKGLATRTDVMIYISAQQCEKSIYADFHDLIRAGKDEGNFGKTDVGLVLIGGKGDDIIVGSQSDDTIVGWEGADRLLGMGGSDTIFGDGATKSSPTDFLHSIDDASGGNDYIDGGDDFDTISAGGGAMDSVVNDPNQPGRADSVAEAEESPAFKDQAAPEDLNGHLELKGWTRSDDSNTGEVVLTKDPSNPVADDYIKITAPEGYTLAYAQADGNDIIATLTKMDEDDYGDPKTTSIRIRMRGALANGNQTDITINASDSTEGGGSIFDLSKLPSGANNITLNGNVEKDVLIGPMTNLDELRIRAEDLEDRGRRLSNARLTEILDATRPVNKATNQPEGEANWGGVSGWSVQNGEIVLNTDLDNLELVLADPKDFQVNRVFKKTDGNDLIVYLVRVTDKENGTLEVIKIRIKNGAAENAVKSIVVGSQAERVAEAFGEVRFSGSGDDDLIVGSIGNTTEWGDDDSDSDTILQGWLTDAVDEPFDPNRDSDGDGVSDLQEMPFGTENDPDRKPTIEETPPAGGGEGEEGDGTGEEA